MSKPIFSELTDDEMYSAVMQSDAQYDGVFYLGVSTTGIYCLPSCTCRKPQRKNIRYFASRKAAVEAGFRPCKRCCPDMEGGRRGYEAAIVEQVKALAAESLETVTVEQLANEVALSKHYLMRIFRRVEGVSLWEYVRNLRVAEAAEMLQDGKLSILEISSAAGYESPSGLYAAFNSVMDTPPGAYRRALTAGSR